MKHFWARARILPSACLDCRVHARHGVRHEVSARGTRDTERARGPSWARGARSHTPHEVAGGTGKAGTATDDSGWIEYAYFVHERVPFSPSAPYRVALVRHGETDWNAQQRYQGHMDLPLNATGTIQAEDAAASVAQAPWDAILSSPLIRAQSTAAIIASSLGLAGVATNRGLIERSFGQAEGVPMSEAARRWPDGHFPGAESIRDVEMRMAATWSRIAQEYANQSVILVCHVVIVRALTRLLTGGDPGQVRNGSVTILHRHDQQWSIEACGEESDGSHIP